MPYKDKEKQKKSQRESYERNIDKVRESGKRTRKRRIDFVSNYKAARGCRKCGESDPVVLDLHHLDSKRKEGNIAFLIRGSSMKKIEKEIKKCEVLCSNCHRKLHYYGYI